MTEADLQAAVIDLARVCKWRVHHSRTAWVQRRDGSTYHATPLTGDPGFPDLVLARDGQVLFVELKSERGRLSPDQQAWISALHEVRVLRPHDWYSGQIAEVLR